MKIISKSIISSLLLVGNLSAHSLWVNSFESFTHKPGHTTVGIGWGHSLPIDDTLNSVNGKIIIKSFDITSPSGKSTKLRIPTSQTKEADIKASNFEVYDSDIGLQKISFKDKSEKGTYVITAKSKPTFYTKYIDKKDRQRLKLKSMDQIKDIKKVLMSIRYESIAKSYISIDKWSEQKASNKGLELIPKNDLSKVEVGDLIEFKILLNGKPLSLSASNLLYIEAYSDNFGQKDHFSLMSYVQNGKAQIRVPAKGKWIVNFNYKLNVTKDGDAKELYGKVTNSFYAASLTFNVK